jgi:hypothetical protein
MTIRRQIMLACLGLAIAGTSAQAEETIKRC